MSQRPITPPLIPTTVTRRKRISTALLALIFLIVLFVGTCASLAGWAGYRFLRSNVRSKNEFQAKVQAELDKIRAAGLPATAKELNTWYPAPPDDQNAAIVLEKAFDALHLPSDPNSPVFNLADLELPRHNKVLPPELKAAATGLIARNSKCLSLIHEALQKGQCRFPVTFQADGDTQLPHLKRLRECGNLLAFKCRLALDAHETDAAFTALDDEARLPHTLAKEPSIISQLVRAGLDEDFLHNLEFTLNRRALSDSQLQKLQQDAAREDDPALAFKGLVGERCINYFGGVKGPPIAGNQQQPQEPKSKPWSEAARYKVLVYMNRLVAASRLPPFERIRAEDTVRDEMQKEDNLNNRKFNSGKLTRLLHLPEMISTIPDTMAITVVEPLIGACTIQDRYTACLALEHTSIAIERFRLKNGRPPGSLSELVPDYLSSVPIDPYTQKPLPYEVHGQGYTLHSVAQYPPDVEKPEPSAKFSKVRNRLTVIVDG